MPYIPSTDEDMQAMLGSIGLNSIEDLFSEIPKHLQIKTLSDIKAASSEMDLFRELRETAAKDKIAINFIGAGAYEHYIPAAVWELASRGEWMTAYTPYQAEASQGTLQLLYEYQSMMARLMQMEVSNASLYDGASALAEAVLMALRCQAKRAIAKSAAVPLARILIPSSLHPHYRHVVKTIAQTQSLDIVDLPYSKDSGRIEKSDLKKFAGAGITAIVIPQPNFFGVLEDVDMISEFAEQESAFKIAVVNPTSMAILKPPGLWGKNGVDIACGEGQPLGIPLASGGPYFGFFCCKKEFIRQLPGRLVGRTKDSEEKTGFTLTLQAREQHIRRAKATSNICTNQGLLVAAATFYLCLMGNQGLLRVATDCHAKTALFRKKLSQVKGVKVLFSSSPFFHETLIQFPVSLDIVLKKCWAEGIEPGFDLRQAYPELGESLLVCTTETKSEADLDFFVESLKKIV